MNTRLHLLCSADAAAWRDCRGQLAEGDCVLLLDRGVEWLLAAGFLAGFGDPEIRVRVLREAAQARGLEALAGRQPGVLIDRAEWVRLIESHQHVLSWR